METMNKIFRGRFKLRENIELVVRGKDGNIKPVFQPNKLFQFLISIGVVSPLFYKIPFLLGSWQQSLNISNLLPTVGKAGVASRINGDGSEAVFTYIAVGTGVTGAAAGDTTLETETAASGLSRAAGSASRSTTDVTNDTAELTKTFTVTGTVAVTESGVLNASSNGVLLNRQVFSAVNVVSGDSLQVTHKFDVD